MSNTDCTEFRSKTSTKKMCQSTLSTSTAAGCRQRQIERDHFKDITSQLQMLVEKKKALEQKNRYLQQERNTMEGERARRFAKFTQTYEEKVNKVRIEKDMLKQKIASMQRQIDNALNCQRSAEKKLVLMVKEKDGYEAQLAEARKNLAARGFKVEKIQGRVDMLERETKKLKDEIVRYRKQNSSLIIQKSELEERIRSENEALQKHTADVEQFRLKMAEKEELHVTKLTEQRQWFEREKESLQKDFEEKRITYRSKTTEECDRNKAEWMKAFKLELETKLRTLNETNQSLEHNAKVLEDQNDEYKTTLNKFRRESETVKKRGEKEISEIREQLTEQYQEMERKYTAELAFSRKNKARQEKLRNELQLELTEVKKTANQKIDELQRNVKRHQRDNEKMKELLREKDCKLKTMQNEHVDYFQEINTLQRVLASAEDAPIVTEDDGFLYSSRPTKKRRLSEATPITRI